jgi:ABC-type transport system involved in multi-copper enzyme maturation permease subunit
MRGIIRSEWTKFFSYPWCVAGAIAAVLITPSVLLVMAGNETSSAQDATTACMRALFLGQAGIIVAAAGLCGQEYEQSCLRTTFLAVPARIKMMAAKWVVITIATILVGMLSGLLGLTIGIIQNDGYMPLHIVVGFVASAAFSLISWVQMAWISAGLSMLTKTMIVPLAILLPLVLSLSQMLYSFSKLAKFLPDLAAINLFLIPKTEVFLAEWPGIAVQFVWAALCGAAAVCVTLGSDVR